MAMATYSTYKAKEGGVAYPRDASFSSYLDSTERDFVRNLAASIHNQSPARESSATPRASLRKNRIPQTELGVFGAERYFNEKLDGQKSPSLRKNRGVRDKQKYRREKIIDLLENKSTKSTISTISSLKSPTPSLKSEGSCKSQFGGLKILSGLQCKGVCVDNSTICTSNTQEKVQSPNSNKGDNNRYRESNKVSHQEHFAFPIIDSSYNHLEDQPRKSLEVFGFRHIGKQDIAQNIERKLSILAWDVIPNSQNNPFQFPFPSNKKKSLSIKTNEHEHDTRSEASSDLFEIEHLSGIPTSQTSYATSEASIEWSVVTASAADFSMFSGFQDDEKMSNASKSTKKISTMEKLKVQKKSSSLGGGLLGCRSHKAIDIVGSFNKNNIKKN